MKIKLDPGAYMPERAHATDAGLDLKAWENTMVPARGGCVIDTGVHACHYCLDTGVTRTSLGVLGRGCRLKKERRGRR